MEGQRKINIRENDLSNTPQRTKINSNIRISNKDNTVVQQSTKSKCIRQTSKGFSISATTQGAVTNIVHYLGIASDEPDRIKRHTAKGKRLPLVEIGWDEAYCRRWCEQNDLLSPIYTTVTRGGCWFCHNQSVEQLRLLRKNYPDLWNLLLKWDKDSPVTFHADGHTVHDFDKRFAMEDEGIVPTDKTFRWNMLNSETQQIRFLF